MWQGGATNDQLKYPNLDPTLNSYMQRSENGDPRCVFVDMNTEGNVQFSKLPEKEEAIFTIGLGGCLAVALVLRTSNENEYAHLIHADSFHAKIVPASINAFAISIKQKENIEKAKLILVGPGKEYDDKYNLIPDFSLYDEIITQIKQVFANTVPNIVNLELAYQAAKSPGVKNQGVFRIVKSKNASLRFVVDNYYPSGDIFCNDK